MLTARNAVSKRPRTSAREGIHDDVDAEACVVYGREALVIRVVIPFGAVILVTEQNLNAIAFHHCFQVLVNEIVSPAIELVTRRGRAIIELEEAAEDRIRVREISRLPERSRDLLECSLAEHSVDVVVVIIDEYHSTAIDELLHVPPLGLGKTKRHVSGEIHERVFENSLG